MTLAEQAVHEHQAIQIVAELEMLVQFLLPRQRGRALEIGSEHGGMLWLLAQLYLDVVSVDIKPVPLQLPGVTYVTHDSHDPAILQYVNGTYDFIFIDADHSYEAVKADFEMFSPLLAKNGVIGLHDVCSQDFEVIKFWKELQQTHETIEFNRDQQTTNGIGLVLG